MVRRFGLCVLAVLFLIGCSQTKIDVVGNWVMSESSSQYMPTQLRGSTPKLVINSDGTFSASNMPGSFHFSSEIISNTGQGKWTRITDEGQDEIQLTFDGSYGGQLLVSDSWGGPTLSYFLGIRTKYIESSSRESSYALRFSSRSGSNRLADG